MHKFSNQSKYLLVCNTYIVNTCFVHKIVILILILKQVVLSMRVIWILIVVLISFNNPTSAFPKIFGPAPIGIEENFKKNTSLVLDNDTKERKTRGR